MRDTLNKILTDTITHPLVISGSTVVMGASSLEDKVKLAFYIISIIATCIVSVKYLMEINKLRKE